MADGGKDGSGVRGKSYVIVHNVSKRANVGTLARSCTAFGVEELLIVGSSKNFNTFGSHGSCDFVKFRHFYTLEDCVAWLRGRGTRVLGIEICDGAHNVASHPFHGDTAFLLGNEGDGLSAKQMALCDGFVYIAQHGEGTASLNVTVAGSIVLHHFATWARFPEREREGFKFVVGDRPPRTTKRGVVPPTEEELAEIRARRAGASAQDDGETFGGDLFD
ncbi:unnamed protein product [Pedinophyceae sp. YPF-701]|nr:unnamed protein product [Pedinophyceae sp. YPF-701]